MKPNFFLNILILVFVFLCSCKKNPVEIPGPVKPVPSDSSNQRDFTLVFENLAQYPNLPDSFIAVLTIKPAQALDTERVITIPVVKLQKYTSRKLSLPAGSYSIRKLLLKEPTGRVTFAAPIVGSVKAAAVQKPLDIDFVLQEKTGKQVPVEVIFINTGDTPQQFGYPAGSFGEAENEMDKLIFIRPIIKVGAVIYDSIPVHLVVRSWDAKNEMTYASHYLAAGTQPVLLSAKAVKYQLSISKWGVNDELILQKNEIRDSTLYDVGGAVAATNLKIVYEYQVTAGKSIPLTKSSYEYHADGTLKNMLLQGKKPDQSTYTVRKDEYEYSGGRISAIKSFDDAGAPVKNVTAQYNAEGKISYIEEQMGADYTRATVTYTPLETRSGLSQDYRIDAQLSYSHNLHSGFYSKTMRGGSVLRDERSTSHGNREEGLYEYDFGINPYVHLGIPDGSFRLYEKHNLITQWKTYYAAYPEEEAYQFSYKYNANGYPIELLTTYRSYQTKAETRTIKTVFVY